MTGAPEAAGYLKDPNAIYQASFATIRKEADLGAIPEETWPVAIRLIHACGMPDIINDLVIDKRAIQAGKAAIGAGRPILVDATMVSAGIQSDRLAIGNEIICTLRDERTASLARTLGTTRSAAAVDFWAPHLKDAVVAIGNAPTALFRLLELIEEGAPRPALVLGFPVGFVGAVEAKDALIEKAAADPSMPAVIALRGRRGGSALASAAVNAITRLVS